MGFIRDTTTINAWILYNRIQTVTMLIQNLTNPALINTIDSYTKKFIHYILRGDYGRDYFSSKETLEALLAELKKRKLNQPA